MPFIVDDVGMQCLSISATGSSNGLVVLFFARSMGSELELHTLTARLHQMYMTQTRETPY